MNGDDAFPGICGGDALVSELCMDKEDIFGDVILIVSEPYLKSHAMSTQLLGVQLFSMKAPVILLWALSIRLSSEKRLKSLLIGIGGYKKAAVSAQKFGKN